jgi:hypothetical protein
VSQRLRSLLLLVVVAAALVAPSTARPHEVLAHHFPIQANPGVVTYVDTFTGHWGWYLNVESTWSQVGNQCGFLHHVYYYYYNISRPALPGVSGVLLPNSQWLEQWVDSHTYYTAGWSYPHVVNRWICGGWGNNVGLLTAKVNADYDTATHVSKTVWYRP